MGETGTLANGNATTSTATSTVDVVVPAEVENTLNRLSAYRHVRGVMILARSQASTPASSNNDPNIPATGGIIQFTGNVFEGDSGKKYAHALEGVVGTVAQAITDCEEGDELRFMRIRTKKHELIITPDEKFLLVVLQDPGQ